MSYRISVDDFSKFYQAQRQKLLYYLMRMTGDYYLSGDIMQESFARLLKHYGRDGHKASLLFRIARNAVLDHVRKNGRNSAPETEGRDLAPDCEQMLMVKQEYRRVLAAMRRLDTAERDLLALVADSGFSYQEIAQITGMSEGNVRVRVHRARVKLKDLLREGTSHE